MVEKKAVLMVEKEVPLKAVLMAIVHSALILRSPDYGSILYI
jgi:hypothetical protein